MLAAISPHLSVLDQLGDHLEVLWGALVAFAIVVLLAPMVGGMARRLGVVDIPGGRRINPLPVPRLGGIALFLGMLVPALAFLHVGHQTRGLLLGATIAVTVGIVDDFRGLPWYAKLAGQVAAAAVATGFGIWVDRFTFPFVGIHTLPSSVGIPLTIIWIVAIMNMVNFLDGLDGLAAGVAAIAGLTFSVIALSLGKVDAAILSAIVFGACVGFLRHNFYPARIIMGDSGALLLGYMLATISVQGLLKTAATVALFFPLLVLAIPIVDTTFVVVRRLKHGEPRVRGGPGPSAPPLPAAGLLAAARGPDDLGLVHHARGRGVRDAVRPVPRPRRLASLVDGARRGDRPDGGALLGLRRLRARDREARQPDPEAAQAGRSAAQDRLLAQGPALLASSGPLTRVNGCASLRSSNGVPRSGVVGRRFAPMDVRLAAWGS